MFFLILAVAMMGVEIVGIVHQHGVDAAASPVVAVAPTVADVAPRVPAAQSWDQENLKRNDRGCPTAIYVAPAGVLEECQ